MLIHDQSRMEGMDNEACGQPTDGVALGVSPFGGGGKEWQERCRLSECGKQLLKLFYRTGCTGKTWDFIETALNEAEHWTEDDWRDLHDESWDMAVEGAERLRKAEGDA